MKNNIVRYNNNKFGLIEGVFMFPETERQYKTRLLKYSYITKNKTLFINYKKKERKDYLDNYHQRVCTDQWYEINRTIVIN